MTDRQNLVAEFVKTGSEAAFRELVSRYVNLVYSVAFRLVDDDPHRAQDVVQTVFVDFARLARTLPDDVMLGGWLHRHTCFVAAKTMRGERRRQFRERQAVEMSALQSHSEVNFSQVAPLLDGAINELGERDRQVVLLRFFEQLDFRAIGEAIGASEDSARMRVNRALEKLESLLKRQGVTSTTAALTGALAANAVQAAPAGMAAAVSTFALTAGALAPASAVVVATKTAALTLFQKTVVTSFLAVAASAALYEASQAADLRAARQTLQQQQAPLAGQLQQLRRDYDEATNQLASILAENQRLKASPDVDELLRLRGKLSQLQTAQALATNDPTLSAAQDWYARISRLKAYVEKHPEVKIPELPFLYDGGRWFNAVESGSPTADEVTDPADYYRSSISFLQDQAQGDFGGRVQIALRKYADANQGLFPTDLAQLQPYCDPAVNDILQSLYEIKPASLLPASVVQNAHIEGDWVVVRKHRADPRSPSREAFYANGCVWWNPPAGPDNP